MGNMLRRHWLPIAGITEFEHAATKPVRLMGEDLVLYKDLEGRFGLVQRRCAHRSADLSYGFVEACGLRCSYHGWLYDQDGRCIEAPYEDVAHPEARLKERVRITAYPVALKGGLVWAYLGPQPAPLVPDWEFFHWQNGFVQIVTAEIPCNWLQCQENSIDPVHFEWQHSNWSVRLKGEGDYVPKHIRLDFTEFEHGFQYKRITEATDESHALWQIGRVCLWPNALFTGDHVEWRVPIDDENTLSITWSFTRVPKEKEPYVQGAIPAWRGPIADPRTGRLIDSHVMNQDFIAWIGQGRINDRTKETLGQSDKGIALMRRRLLEDLDAVERGEDPKGLIRDPGLNDRVQLPIADRALLEHGIRSGPPGGPGGPGVRGYIFQAGQPDSVRLAFEEAIGMRSAVEG